MAINKLEVNPTQAIHAKVLFHICWVVLLILALGLAITMNLIWTEMHSIGITYPLWEFFKLYNAFITSIFIYAVLNLLITSFFIVLYKNRHYLGHSKIESLSAIFLFISLMIYGAMFDFFHITGNWDYAGPSFSYPPAQILTLGADATILLLPGILGIISLFTKKTLLRKILVVLLPLTLAISLILKFTFSFANSSFGL